MNKKAGWQHFKHIADIGIKGFGSSVEMAFTQAAMAMTAVITELELVDNNICIDIDIDCESADLEYLFVDWLNALVYEMATRHMLFSQFDIQIHDGHLKAKVCGERVNREKHQPAVEVKGATLTELRVQKNKEGDWLAQCVIDV